MNQLNAQFYIVSIIIILKQLHSINIAYRDLKPENILINYDGRLKLGDFGLAKLMKNRSYSNCGSMQYMAPEIVNSQPHSFEVDYYAIGILLYEMLIGCPPFYHPNNSKKQTQYHIMYSQVQFPSDIDLSDQVKDLIISLTKKKYTQRLGYKNGFDEIMLHNWFRNIEFKQYQEDKIEPPFKVNFLKNNFDYIMEDQEVIQFNKLIQNDLYQCRKKRLRNLFKTVSGSTYNLKRAKKNNKIGESIKKESSVLNQYYQAPLKTISSQYNPNISNEYNRKQSLVKFKDIINKKYFWKNLMNKNSIDKFIQFKEQKKSLQEKQLKIKSFMKKNSQSFSKEISTKKAIFKWKENKEIKSIVKKLPKKNRQWKNKQQNIRITLC